MGRAVSLRLAEQRFDKDFSLGAPTPGQSAVKAVLAQYRGLLNSMDCPSTAVFRRRDILHKLPTWVAADATKQVQWTAFLRKNKLDATDLADVVRYVRWRAMDAMRIHRHLILSVLSMREQTWRSLLPEAVLTLKKRNGLALRES